MKRVRSSFEGISVEDAIYAILSDATGVIAADMVLQNATLSSDFTVEDRLNGLNHLVEQRLVVMMNVDGHVFVQVVPTDVQPRLKLFTTEEGLVFDEITKFGTNGATLKVNFDVTFHNKQ
jgi:hypothetical protein